MCCLCGAASVRQWGRTSKALIYLLLFWGNSFRGVSFVEVPCTLVVSFEQTFVI